MADEDTGNCQDSVNGGDKSRCRKHRGRDTESVEGLRCDRGLGLEMGDPSAENIIIFFLEMLHFGAFYYHPCNHYLCPLARWGRGLLPLLPKYALGNYLEKIPNLTVCKMMYSVYRSRV